MKINTETTKTERLRLLLGGVFAMTGLFTVIVLGSFTSYADANLWAIGLGLIIIGLLMAGSTRLIVIFQDLTRF